MGARRREQSLLRGSSGYRRKASIRLSWIRGAIASWRPSEGMKCQILAFDAREARTFRMCFSSTDPDHPVCGKTSEHADVVLWGISRNARPRARPHRAGPVRSVRPCSLSCSTGSSRQWAALLSDETFQRRVSQQFAHRDWCNRRRRPLLRNLI